MSVNRKKINDSYLKMFQLNTMLNEEVEMTLQATSMQVHWLPLDFRI